MLTSLRSIWVWFATVTLIVSWVPLLAIIRLFDRDPVRYRTGRWFRRLGMTLVKVNPSWRVHISGKEFVEKRQSCIVVSNHQSLADIPLISCLPCEMKWIAKIELFKLPFIGWMMRMAGDIPVDRQRRGATQALVHAKRYLQNRCPVMIFPEGTRSHDGRVHRFTDGAFHLAIRNQVPVLPLAVEGSYNCLPKGKWKFGDPQDVFLRVFPPISTTGLTVQDVAKLRDQVREMIVKQVAEWRGMAPQDVDALAESSL